MMKKIFTLIVLLFLILNIFVSKAHALTIFYDDFEDGNDDGWIRKHYQGPNTLGQWQVINGKYGMQINTTYTVGQSTAGDPNWTDYQYELEMHTFSGSDKNFLFRYNENYQAIKDVWYEIHASGTTLTFSKSGAGTFQDPNLPLGWPKISNYQILNGKKYYWRVVAIENHFEIFVREENEINETKVFDVIDTNHPYMQGSIGVRVGTGPNPGTNVFFDNIQVTDLTSPSPTPTPSPSPTPTPTPYPAQNTPYFSQRDYNQATNSAHIYDHTDKTISRLGCALTSAAMVLKSYYHELLPDNNNINPSSLNQWLVNNNGYNQLTGGISWGAVSRVTKLLNNTNSSAIKLEHSSTKNLSEVDQILKESHHPVIFREKVPQSSSGIHFVVATNVIEDGKTYQILDPYNSNRTTFDITTDEFIQAEYFQPTNSDFSYIYAFTNPEVKILITNPNQLQTGEINNVITETIPNSHYINPQVIADYEDPSTTAGKLLKEINVKYPITGNYLIRLQSAQSGEYDLGLVLDTQDAETRQIVTKVNLLAQRPQTYTLYYDHDSTASAQLISPTTFESLRQLITHHGQQGNIKNPRLTQALINKLTYIEGLYPKYPTTAKNLLLTVKQTIEMSRRDINQVAYDEIHPAIIDLINQL